MLGLQPRDGLGPVVLGVKMDLPDLGGGNDQLSSCGGNDSHFLTLIPPLTPTEYLHSSLRGSAPSQRGQALFLLRSEPRSAARLSRSRIPPPACGPRALGSSVLSSAGHYGGHYAPPRGLCTCCWQGLEHSSLTLPRSRGAPTSLGLCLTPPRQALLSPLLLRGSPVASASPPSPPASSPLYFFPLVSPSNPGERLRKSAG